MNKTELIGCCLLLFMAYGSACMADQEVGLYGVYHKNLDTGLGVEVGNKRFSVEGAMYFSVDESRHTTPRGHINKLDMKNAIDVVLKHFPSGKEGVGLYWGGNYLLGNIDAVSHDVSGNLMGEIVGQYTAFGVLGGAAVRERAFIADIRIGYLFNHSVEFEDHGWLINPNTGQRFSSSLSDARADDYYDSFYVSLMLGVSF